MDKFCQNCHQQNAPDAMFCRQCASPLPPANQSGTDQGQHNNQQTNQQGNQHGGGNYIPRPDNFPPTSDRASGRAITALILTVCGLIFCCGPVTAIPGAILGWMELSAIKEGRSSPKGLLLAQISLWGGIGVSIVVGLFSLLYFKAMISAGMNY